MLIRSMILIRLRVIYSCSCSSCCRYSSSFSNGLISDQSRAVHAFCRVMKTYLAHPVNPSRLKSGSICVIAGIISGSWFCTTGFAAFVALVPKVPPLRLPIMINAQTITTNRKAAIAKPPPLEPPEEPPPSPK